MSDDNESINFENEQLEQRTLNSDEERKIKKSEDAKSSTNTNNVTYGGVTGQFHGGPQVCAGPRKRREFVNEPSTSGVGVSARSLCGCSRYGYGRYPVAIFVPERPCWYEVFPRSLLRIVRERPRPSGVQVDGCGRQHASSRKDVRVVSLYSRVFRFGPLNPTQGELFAVVLEYVSVHSLVLQGCGGQAFAYLDVVRQIFLLAVVGEHERL